MAIMYQNEDRHCDVCGKVTPHVSLHYPSIYEDRGKCIHCLARKHVEAEIKRIDAWNSMSVDERLNDIRVRLERLESLRGRIPVDG